MPSPRPGLVVGNELLPSALRHLEMLGHWSVPIFFPFQMTAGGNMMGELLTRFLLRANPRSANFHKNSFRGLWGCSLQRPLSRTHQTGESGFAFSSRLP